MSRNITPKRGSRDCSPARLYYSLSDIRTYTPVRSTSTSKAQSRTGSTVSSVMQSQRSFSRSINPKSLTENRRRVNSETKRLKQQVSDLKASVQRERKGLKFIRTKTSSGASMRGKKLIRKVIIAIKRGIFRELQGYSSYMTHRELTYKWHIVKGKLKKALKIWNFLSQRKAKLAQFHYRSTLQKMYFKLFRAVCRPKRRLGPKNSKYSTTPPRLRSNKGLTPKQNAGLTPKQNASPNIIPKAVWNSSPRVKPNASFTATQDASPRKKQLNSSFTAKSGTSPFSYNIPKPNVSPNPALKSNSIFTAKSQFTSPLLMPRKQLNVSKRNANSAAPQKRVNSSPQKGPPRPIAKVHQEQLQRIKKIGTLLKRIYFNVWKRSRVETDDEADLLDTIADEHLRIRTLANCFSGWCIVNIDKKEEDPYDRLINEWLENKYATKAFNSWVLFFKDQKELKVREFKKEKMLEKANKWITRAASHEYQFDKINELISRADSSTY